MLLPCIRTFAAPIYKNKGRCKKCGTVVESAHIRSIVPCLCGAVTLSGGAEDHLFTGDPEDFERIWELLPNAIGDQT